MGWGTCAQVSPSEQLARAHLSVCPDPLCLGQCAPEPRVGVGTLGEEPGAQAQARPGPAASVSAVLALVWEGIALLFKASD